ncbi:accessory gene regulator protein A [Erysipelotrichaceae bacterium]|nr:accessory gene regulator protein A [Erysipelotrichaceae bacterium]
MLSVYILEDDAMHRASIEKIIRDTIMIEELEMELACVSANPVEVIEYVRMHPKPPGVYFFDVDLKTDMTGIAAAVHVRKMDENGKIIFVTTRGELSYLTFTHKIEALDYIVKDNPDEIARRIRECLLLAQTRYYQEKRTSGAVFRIQEKEMLRSFPHEDIMFFETGNESHQILLHTANAHIYFSASLSEIAMQSEQFFRCHKSYVVHLKNIVSYDKKEKKITCKNGEHCYVSIREQSRLLKALRQQ